MKKRLLSLLLAVAMMVAVLPTAAFAGDEAGTEGGTESSTSTEIADLAIDGNGIPYNTSDSTKNLSSGNTSGNGWAYDANSDCFTIKEGYSLKLTNANNSISCNIENHGTIEWCYFNLTINNTTDGKLINYGTIKGGVFLRMVEFKKEDGQTTIPTIADGVFCGKIENASIGSITGGAFAYDPGETQGKKHAVTVDPQSGLKITGMRYSDSLRGILPTGVSVNTVYIVGDVVSSAHTLQLEVKDANGDYFPNFILTSSEDQIVAKVLSITADGKPDVEGIAPTTDNGKKVYTGYGWQYTNGTNLSWLSLGVDSEGNALNSERLKTPLAFTFNNPTSSSCSVNIYHASLSDSTVNATVQAESSGVSITNCVLNYLAITKSNGASATVKNCIFPNSSYAISDTSACTLEGWNIFAKDPGVTGEHTISVTNGGKIKKLEIGNTKIAMDTANLYIVGTLDRDLNLTLDDGTVHTVTPDMVKYSSGSTLPKHIPLTIKEDGTPNVDGMTLIDGEYYVSDNWYYRLGIYGDPYLTLGSSFSDAIGPYPVSCEVVNDGTITGGVFTKTVSGSGTITGGVFLQKPAGTNIEDLHTITAGASRTFTKLTVGNQTVSLDADTTEFYVVGTPSSDLTIVLSTSRGESYTFVIPADTLTSDMILHEASNPNKSKDLEINADGKPDLSGMYYCYLTKVPGVKTYFGNNWHYISYSNNASDGNMLCLDTAFNGSLGSTPVTVNVYNSGTLTGGIINAALRNHGTVQNVVVYGDVEMGNPESSIPVLIENSILCGNLTWTGTAQDTSAIQNCLFAQEPEGDLTLGTISATDGAKIKTVTMGGKTMTLPEGVDTLYFSSDSSPKDLTVTLDDGTEYKNIDLTQTTITLVPTKRDDPTAYYTVIVEGGEVRNERGDILDSEVVVTAGEKITLKLLDETQGEMVFSYWDVNNSNTDLADELAKTGFDKTAHETTFTMPAHDLTLTAKYRMPEEDAPQDDSFLMTAAAVTGGAVLTGLVVWQGYNIFSQVYLNAHLPEGTTIPANRQQLALLLWNAAGQPEASAASYVFPDVADPDAQAAARWATEQGLLKARKDGTFAPTDSVTTGQVYRAWQKVKMAG